MDGNKKWKVSKDDELSLRQVEFMVAPNGDPPRHLEKQNKILIEKSFN